MPSATRIACAITWRLASQMGIGPLYSNSMAGLDRNIDRPLIPCVNSAPWSAPRWPVADLRS